MRDNEGVVVAVSCWQVFSLPDSEVTEALAMWKELEFAKDMCFLNLIAESDTSNLVQALNTRLQYPNYVESIIGDCINFNVFFRSLSFLHVRHEANQVAHYLAQYFLHNPYCIWIKETPPCISAVLAFDFLLDFYK